MSRRSNLQRTGAAILLAAIVQTTSGTFAQQQPGSNGSMTAHAPDMMQHDHQSMMRMHGQSLSDTPVMPGQGAFSAIQEIVGLLEADPKTDWSKVDLEALRQHLIDMNEVTLKAAVTSTTIDGGLEMTVTGEGRTLASIQRMVPAHTQELNKMNSWRAKTEALSNGVRLTVTASDSKEVAHIRGLGFIGRSLAAHTTRSITWRSPRVNLFTATKSAISLRRVESGQDFRHRCTLQSTTFGNGAALAGLTAQVRHLTARCRYRKPHHLSALVKALV